VASLLEQLKQEEAERPEDSLDAKPATDSEYQKLLIRRAERQKAKVEGAARQKEAFDPNKDPQAAGDPYKTLFISKLSKEATEEDLRREFAMYGHIDNLRIVRDLESGKSKGYAFILYEREKDMKGAFGWPRNCSYLCAFAAAYKDAEGIKILGKRIMVDVERGRTVKDWKPMRLGGGLGGRPKPVSEQDSYGGFVSCGVLSRPVLICVNSEEGSGVRAWPAL
jgi:U1 small nuclear ribonucleoprotein